MSNKYEREIEEILRNLERTEPKASFGQRISGRMRRKTRARRSMPTLRLAFSEWCLIIASVAALVAGGWAYAHKVVFLINGTAFLGGGGNLITGIIALFGAGCLILVALSAFFNRPRVSSSSARLTNVTRLRYNPFRRFAVNWHLLMLKLRFRNRRGGER